MTTPAVRFLRLLAATVFVLPLAACAATVSSKALEGKVLEEGANKPVANAMVIVRWIGDIDGIGHGSSVCFHVETATTDNQGRFHVPAWKKPSPYGDIAHPRAARYAHAPGYVFVRADKEAIYLQSFTGTREERLKYLLHVSGLVGCYGASDEKKLVPVYKALYDEAKAIATSEKDKDALQTIRRRALYAWSRPSRELTSNEIEQAIQNDPHLREQFQ